MHDFKDNRISGVVTSKRYKGCGQTELEAKQWAQINEARATERFKKRAHKKSFAAALADRLSLASKLAEQHDAVVHEHENKHIFEKAKNIIEANDFKF